MSDQSAKKARLTVDIDRDLHRVLKIRCVEKGEDMKDFVVRAIEAALKAEGKIG